MATSTFLDDVAAILQVDASSPVVKELAGLAWRGAGESKGKRIELFADYIQQRDLDTISLNDESYNTLELLISLTHFKRARYG